MGTLTRTLRLPLKVKDAVIVVFPPRNAAHIITSHRWRRRHLEKDAQRYYSGTRAWNCCFFATAAISVSASETGGGNYRQSRSDENIHFVLLCIISACDSLSAVLMNCPPQKRAAWNLLRVLWILSFSWKVVINTSSDRTLVLSSFDRAWKENSVEKDFAKWLAVLVAQIIVIVIFGPNAEMPIDSIINIQKYSYLLLHSNILNMKLFPYFMKLWISCNKIRLQNWMLLFIIYVQIVIWNVNCSHIIQFAPNV